MNNFAAVTFAQKYEVRQVYVRSTARIYEIYYAPDLGSSNEYLCTVRCGVATRGEEVLCAPSLEEAVAHLKGANKETDENKSKSDSSLNTNEDGWVEVKALDSPQLDNGNSLPPSSGNAKHGERLQVTKFALFYIQISGGFPLHFMMFYCSDFVGWVFLFSSSIFGLDSYSGPYAKMTGLFYILLSEKGIQTSNNNRNTAKSLPWAKGA